MRIILIAAAVLALAATATTASAKPIVSKTGQVQVELPDDWNAQAEGDVLLVAADKNKEIVVVFMILPKEETQKALAALDAKIGKDVKNDKWNKPQQVTLNEMSGVAVEGTADLKGKPCSIAAMVLSTPNNHNVVVFGAVRADKEAAHQKEITAIMQSLKPVK
jgi:hypothetical protein